MILKQVKIPNEYNAISVKYIPNLDGTPKQWLIDYNPSFTDVTSVYSPITSYCIGDSIDGKVITSVYAGKKTFLMPILGGIDINKLSDDWYFVYFTN